MRSDASQRSGRSRLTQSVGPRSAHRSPLTAHRSPLTAHRSPLTALPLTAHRSPLTAHRSRTAHRSPLTAHRSPLTAPPLTRSPLTAHRSRAHRSPLTGSRSPLTAHRSPLTAHRSPLTAHRLAASHSATRATTDGSAPVLSPAPLIRVAHSRHASVRPAADHLGRRPPLPPVHTSMRSDAVGQRRGTSVPDRGGAK